MPYNPTSIANYFIAKHGAYYDFEPENLVALTYLANGWHTVLSKDGSPLVDDPVIIYDGTGTFITLAINIATEHYCPFEKKIINNAGNQKIAPDDKKLLDKIWENYSHLSIKQLVNFAYPPGGPCNIAYKEGRGSISNEELRNHFLERQRRINPAVVTK